MKRSAAVLAALLALSAPALAQEPNTNAAKIANSSGNVGAAGAATATLAASGGLMNYVCGFSVTGGGATGAAIVHPTLTGLNGGTLTFSIGVVAGATLATPPLEVRFTPCEPATALNTAITLSVPSFGLGNTDLTANIWGYRLPY